MKNRFLVRRIFYLLIAAILLWTILTALFYSYVANPVFTRIKSRELLPRAQLIAGSVYEQENSDGATEFCIDLIRNSSTLFGNWIYIVDNTLGVRYRTPLPAEPPDLSEKLNEIVLGEHAALRAQEEEHRLGEHRLTGSGDRFLFISVPILDHQQRQTGSVVIVQPSRR